MSGGGGDTEQTVSNEPWDEIAPFLLDLYQRGSDLSQAGPGQPGNPTPLGAIPMPDRMTAIADMWGGNPRDIAQAYGFQPGMLDLPTGYVPPEDRQPAVVSPTTTPTQQQPSQEQPSLSTTSQGRGVMDRMIRDEFIRTGVAPPGMSSMEFMHLLNNPPWDTGSN